MSSGNEPEGPPDDPHFALPPGAAGAPALGATSGAHLKLPRARLRIAPELGLREQTPDYHLQVRVIADSMKVNARFTGEPLAGYAALADGVEVIFVTHGKIYLDALDLAIREGALIDEVPVVAGRRDAFTEDLAAAPHSSTASALQTPYELALACKQLQNMGKSPAEIADLLGKTVQHVRNLLLLMSAPAAVRHLVATGKLSTTLAIKTLREHGPDAVQLLQNGLKNAGEQQKDRVTQKLLAENAQPGAGHAPKASPRLSKKSQKACVAWLRERKLENDKRLLEFLAFLIGTDASEVKTLFETKPSKQAKGIKLRPHANGKTKDPDPT